MKEIKNMKKPCIGLFGTCGNSTWRKNFIASYDSLGINFYNPQVEDWKPEDAEIEAEHLVNDEIILFPVTRDTYGTGSLAETGFSIMSAIRSNQNRFVVIFIDSELDESLKGDSVAFKESTRARALIKAHLKKVKHPNVYVVNNMESMKNLSIQLYDLVVMKQQIDEAYTQ